MTKYQLNRPDGPWDYPALGFRAAQGAILDGTLFSPAITAPPDFWWSVYAGGAAQTGITPISPYGSPAPAGSSPSDGTIPVYRKSLGTNQQMTPADFVADPAVAAAFGAVYTPTTRTLGSTATTILQEVKTPALTASAWRQVSATALFSSVNDPVLFIGWNADRGVGAGDAAEPAWYMGMEAKYRVSSWNGDGLTHDTMEWYVNYNSPDLSVVNFRPFATTVGRDNNASRWATVQVDIGTDTSPARSGFNVIAGGSKNLLHLDNAGSSALYVPLIVATAYGANALTFDSSAAGNAALNFGDAGTSEFQLIRFHGDGNLYLWNLVNNRAHIVHTRGTTNASALTEFASSVKVDGNVGFYGVTPVTRAAHPSTLSDVITLLTNVGLCS